MASKIAPVALLVLAIGLGCLGNIGVDAEDFDILGGGSTALKNYMASALGNASQDIDVKGYAFPYNAVGIGQGIAAFLNGTFVYAVGDLGISTKQAGSTRFLTIPIALSSVSFFYNITGFPSNKSLQLTPEIISGIYTGEITTWDDPLIVKYNDGKGSSADIRTIVKKDQRIYPIARRDSSGGTYIMSKWLSQTVGAAASNTTGAYYWPYPVADVIAWDSDVRTVQGSGGVVQSMQNTTFAIGYVDSSAGLTISPKLTEAALLNKAGQFTTSAKADYTFISSSNGVNTSIITGVPLANDTVSWATYTLVNLPGARSYPLTSIAYLYTLQDMAPLANVGAAAKQLYAYLIGPYVQPGIKSFGAQPLPTAMLNNALAAVNSIKARTTQLFNPVTIAPGFVY